MIVLCIVLNYKEKTLVSHTLHNGRLFAKLIKKNCQTVKMYIIIYLDKYFTAFISFGHSRYYYSDVIQFPVNYSNATIRYSVTIVRYLRILRYKIVEIY